MKIFLEEISDPGRFVAFYNLMAGHNADEIATPRK